MKKEPKIIICLLIFVLGVFGNIYFSTALHLLLSQQIEVLKFLPIMQCMNNLFQSRQHAMLYLYLQGYVFIITIMYYLTNLRPYQSDLVEITPDIKTPVSVGQFQHGSARWLKDEEKDKAFDSFILDASHILMNEITKQGGVVVGLKKESNKERIYYIGEDSHVLCIGATRSGKSRNLVVQSICTLGLAGESIVISDPKAELFYYTSEFLEKLGYEVLVLDFKNPSKSQRYNLLQPIINAVNEGDTDKAEMLAWDLTNNLVGKPEGEKIWTNGECSIIAASILCVVCDNKSRPEYQNLTNVYWFIAEMVKTIGNKMPLLEYVKKLSTSHPARALLSISDVAPIRTRGSFYTSALTTLRLFTGKSIYAITHKSDFQLQDIGQKKQALFIILPDEKTTFYPVASLIVSQQYELLANLADKRGGRLKQRVNFILDEFGNFTSISDFTNKLTVGGGRGIRFNLFIQSFSQLKEKYDENTSDIIKANCQTWVYLQADDMDTLREISEKLGTYTVSSYQLSANHSKFSAPSSSHSISLIERKLLNVDEVRRINRPYQIVTSRKHPVVMYSPDLTKWYFNKMLGLGDKEHNRKLREEREDSRPIITNTNEELALWNIWIYYQKDIVRKMQQQAQNGNGEFTSNESDLD